MAWSQKCIRNLLSAHGTCVPSEDLISLASGCTLFDPEGTESPVPNAETGLLLFDPHRPRPMAVALFENLGTPQAQLTNSPTDGGNPSGSL